MSVYIIHLDDSLSIQGERVGDQRVEATLSMSFGRPGSSPILQANPPDRGSFPLDHEGECDVVPVE